MRRQRNIKIVATLGPASSTREMIEELFLAGADVFRLNMSHGTHEDTAARLKIIRDIEKQHERPICVLGDLQGPKLRCGVFKNDAVMLENGTTFQFDLDDAMGDETRVQLPHPEIFKALEVGSTLLVNDGKLNFLVTSRDNGKCVCEVIIGGEISNRKGVNVPDVLLPLAALSEKDKSDLEFVCQMGVDWIALSFVQRAEDVEEARKLVKGRAAILSKIEKPSAVKEFQSILHASDGIMVARGDLGVELPVQDVPPIQKRLIMECRDVGKPVIVATQMLESMITSPSPTRAEVSDVATAIYEGADAVMLSAESAAGDFPVEAVTTMNNVAIQVESDPTFRDMIEATRTPLQKNTETAITSAARAVAESIDVKAICCFTHSGRTAQLASRERPSVPIIALTPKVGIARKLSLVWGLHCVLTNELERFKMAVVNAARVARRDGFADKDDSIVVTAGVPFNRVGTTNILRVAPADEKLIFEGEGE